MLLGLIPWGEQKKVFSFKRQTIRPRSLCIFDILVDRGVLNHLLDYVSIYDYMTKTKEKKLREQIVGLLKLKKSYDATDHILIDELIDFLKISEYAKKKLESDPDSWQCLTTITMTSKQIQAILTKLNITPQERNRKVKELEEKNEKFDLQKFLTGDN